MRAIGGQRKADGDAERLAVTLTALQGRGERAAPARVKVQLGSLGVALEEGRRSCKGRVPAEWDFLSVSFTSAC